MIIVLGYITGAYFLLTSIYGNQTEKLQAENTQLKMENEQLESEKDYLQKKPGEIPGEDANGYLTWTEYEEVANYMVEKSDGNFKKSWALYLAKEAERYSIDPFLIFELLRVETGNTFNPELVGPETKYGHAYGMAQFMTNTAPWIADMAGLPYEKDLLYDPYYSMQLSLVYLDYLHNRYSNWDKALTAYHRGMTGLENYIEENGHANSWYAEEIQAEADSHQAFAAAP
ncbi:transglycosylase SLT domain-containing protein [Pontibacillus halophilus]|uniref:transglycosylase SLT domain-containing protein n=1 Tax=Pontibacillus halophilus TaxID=516704 RepID=UPI001F281968|nr:transglycosylase SLT domain-containing protein [Pontibacillus halophilus]